MVTSQYNEHEPQADVVFLIEATSMNGAYLNELKSSCIIPILEYFNQGSIENSEVACENRNILYTIILYHAADIRPKPCCRTYAQEKDPHFILSTIDKIKLCGGKAQANANIVEGLATCLQFFDEIKPTREGCQKFCILICTSPPYGISVLENEKYAGTNLEQLAGLFYERNILMSILSPRKIPAFFKLYEKTGGDLSMALSKNYSKNARHLILLNGLSLKERPVSPSNVTAPHNTLSVASPKSNPGNVGSPTPVVSVPFRQSTPQGTPGQVQHQAAAVDIAQQQQIQPQQPQPQQPVQPTPQQTPQPPPQTPQPQHPQGPPQQATMVQQQLPHAPQTNQMLPQHAGQMNTNMNNIPGMNTNFSQPPMNFPRGPAQQTGRWPVPGAQTRPFQSTPQQPSALINQLKQPPNTMPPQFRFDGGQLTHSNVGNLINQNPQMQQFQQLQQHNQQQQQPPQNQQSQPNQIRMMNAGGMMNQQHPPGMMGPSQPMNSSQGAQVTIWQGILEWTDKQIKNPSETTRQIHCAITFNVKDGEPELKADNWPQKLIVQLLPKALISSIGGQYLKNSTSVLFHPQPCDALDALTKVMSSQFAGCIQFNNVNTPNCDIKVLILLYTSDKRVYLGFIPNDQSGFVERLRRLIQARKNNSNMRQGNQPLNTTGSQTPIPTGAMQGQQAHLGNPMMPSGNLNTHMSNQQSHIVPGMPHGNVNLGGGMMPTPNNQQSIIHQNPNALNVPQGSIGIQGNGSMLGPRAPINDHNIEAAILRQQTLARQQNLVKIQQLQQSLDAAHQQELQYQNLQPPYGRHQMVRPQQQQQSQQMRNIHANTVQAASQAAPQFDDIGGFEF